MAMPRRIKVEFGEAFPYGAFAVGEPLQVRDFEKSTREKPVYATDEESGLSIWSVDIVDADPAVNKAGRSVSVKVVSEYCPVFPELPAGTPAHLAFMRPVEFEGLTASPYVADAPGGGGKGRLSWSFRATGLKAPAVGGTTDTSADASAPAPMSGANGKAAKSGASGASAAGEKAAA